MDKKNQQPSALIPIILDSITEGVFTIDQDKIITSFNRAAEKITGFSRRRAVGKKCFEIFQADICQESCPLSSAVRAGKTVVDMPINILNAQGGVIPISITTAVLKNQKGEILGGVETFRDLTALEALRKEISRKYVIGDIVGKSAALQKIFSLLPDIAQSSSTVLIQGPSGTGKELLAKAVHQLSPRKDRPFVAINCSALPETLLESELFGYVRGAFTDAKRDKPGKLAAADGGTLFLDEIGDLPLTVQAKLLRVLQEKTYEPLGSNISKKMKARLISATNKDLKGLVSQERFREDLYYRLKVIQIDLPTLRERREDLPLLIEHFLRKLNLQTGKKITQISPNAMEVLMNYHYPGNIRELENILEHAFVLCHGSLIRLSHLPPELQRESKLDLSSSFKGARLRDQEAEMIREALAKNQGHRARTARELGIHPTTLWRKLKALP